MRRLRPLADDRRGTALIEFAFAVPILLLLFVGGYQMTDAISAYRKVTTTTRALADLTTQTTSLTAAGIQQNLAASRQIMAPYSNANAIMRVSQVKIDASKIARVDWSQALNGSAYTKGQLVVVPTAMLIPNTALIYAETNYQYVPGIASDMFGDIPLRDTILMSPRNSAQVTCTTC